MDFSQGEPTENGQNTETSPVEEAQEMRPPVEEQIRAFARNWLEAQFTEENARPKATGADAHDIEEKIAELSGTTAEYEERKLPQRFCMGIKAFLETYIAFAKEKLHGDAKSRKRAKHLILEVDESLFSFSPNIASYSGGYEDMLELAAQALDAPELHGTLAAHIIGELNYYLSFDGAAGERLKDILSGKPSVKIMELMSVLESIANESAANGSWADAGFKSILNAIEIQKQHPSPLVALYAEAMSRRLKAESENPTLSLVRYRNDPNYGRLGQPTSRDQADEHQHLVRSLRVGKELPSGSKLQYVARDAIAITDQGLVPHEVALLDQSDLTESPFNQNALRQLQSLSASPETVTLAQWSRIIDYINREIFYDIPDNEKSGALTDHWNRLAPQIGRDKWEKYFALETQKRPTRSPMGTNQAQESAREINGLLEQHKNEVMANIALEVERLQSETNDALTPVKFFDIADIYKNERINPFGLKEEGDTKLLSQRFHDPFMREELESALGISLRNISFESQLYLLRFMANADRPTFERLEAVTHRIPDQAIRFLESFLALRMGDEFAESLLTIGEHLSHKEVGEILGSLESIYKSSAEIRNFFDHIDAELGQVVHLAFVKRTTELLLVIKEIIEQGKAEARLYNGEMATATDIPSVSRAITDLQSGLSEIVKVLGPETETHRSQTQPREPEEVVRAFRFKTPKVLIQAREVGAKFGEHDAAREFDGEARINFLVNLKSDEPVPEELAKPLRQQALSIRLDREGTVWIPGASISHIDSDPTRQQGAVSLDIGSIYGEPDNPNVEIGRLLAIGNALITERHGEKANFNHVREVFNEKFGDAKVFADIVRKLETRLAGEK